MRDGVEVGSLVSELALLGVAFWQVGVKPYLYLAVAVHADHVFCWLEVADPEKDLLESIQSTKKYIQVFWVGYILDMAQSDGNVFDVYPSVVVGIAKLFDFFRVYELGIDNGVFPLSPLKEF